MAKYYLGEAGLADGGRAILSVSLALAIGVPIGLLTG